MGWWLALDGLNGKRRKGQSGAQRLIAANGAAGKPGLGLGDKFGKVGLTLMSGEGRFVMTQPFLHN